MGYGPSGMAARFDNQVLKQARLDLGMTQDEAAQRLDVDVRTYRRYETGQVNGAGDFKVQRADRRGFLAKVCAEFGMTEATLVVEAEAPEEEEPGLLWAPRWVHPLPRAQVFVGRDELCAELGKWATTPSPPERLQVLVAAGGSGKSTLAERVASSLGGHPRPGGLFVWSYYSDERSERMLASLLRYLEQDPKLESLPSERLERLVDHLENGAPHLLVFDGLEVVQSDGGDRALGELIDPTLSLLLKHLARGLGRTRALVTTRFPVLDLEPWLGQSVRSIELAPLSPAQGRRLLIGSGVEEAPAIDDLLAHYGGHPLSLAMVANYIARFLDGRADAWGLLDPAEVSSDLAAARRLARVLDEYAQSLPSEERELLTLLSTFPGDLRTEDLIELYRRSSRLELDEASVRRALVRLSERGLVHGDPHPTAHAFVREHFADGALRERLVSRKWCQRTGETQLKLRTHELATRIHSALNRPDALEAKRTEAMRLADSSRASFYQQRLERLASTEL